MNVIIPTNPEEAQAGVLAALETIFNPSNVHGHGHGHGQAQAQAQAQAQVQMQANRHAADQYLIAFQRAPVAWQLADKLLSFQTHINANASASGANGTASASATATDLSLVTQVHFFAAQTLHVKCRSDILQLDPSMLPSLRDSLMVHLSNFIQKSHNTNTVVITRLAMTLCSLAVQMQWTDIIDNLLSKVPMNININATGGTIGIGTNGADKVKEEGMIQVILEIGVCARCAPSSAGNVISPRIVL